MKKIIELRKKCAVTQQYVAYKLGIAQNTYSQYESGKREININLIPKLAEILCCSIEEVVLALCD